MNNTHQEICESDVLALRIVARVELTDSDCRVALREANGDFYKAYHWLIDNRVIDRIKIDMARRAFGDLQQQCGKIVDLLCW